MGWSSGSGIFNKIIDGVKDVVPDEAARLRIYRPIVDAMCDADWDTLDECLDRDPAFDALYREIYPDDYD